MGASGRKVAMLTLTIDPLDPRFADLANRVKVRGGKVRARSTALLDDPRAHVIEQSTSYAAWAWNRFRTYFVREYGALPYFKGLELQKSGMAHLHVLIRVDDATAFLAVQHHIRSTDLAVRAGFGPVIDFQLARSGGDVARYVTKVDGSSGVRAELVKGSARPGQHAAAYVSKTPDALPKYARRSTWSLPNGRAPWAPDWADPTPIAGFDWRVAKCNAATAAAGLHPEDFRLDDPDLYRIKSGPMGPERGSAWLPA